MPTARRKNEVSRQCGANVQRFGRTTPIPVTHLHRELSAATGDIRDALAVWCPRGGRAKTVRCEPRRCVRSEVVDPDVGPTALTKGHCDPLAVWRKARRKRED